VRLPEQQLQQQIEAWEPLLEKLGGNDHLWRKPFEGSIFID
jgi:hypothetical protein